MFFSITVWTSEKFIIIYNELESTPCTALRTAAAVLYKELTFTTESSYGGSISVNPWTLETEIMYIQEISWCFNLMLLIPQQTEAGWPIYKQRVPPLPCLQNQKEEKAQNQGTDQEYQRRTSSCRMFQCQRKPTNINGRQEARSDAVVECVACEFLLLCHY